MSYKKASLRVSGFQFWCVAWLAVCIAGSYSFAQDYSWSENTGWLNWNTSIGDGAGANYEIDAISGYIWGENVGWIHLGEGVPVPQASLQTGEDYGVGVDNDGMLYGFAWGENIGWINFGPFAGTTYQPRFRRGRLHGYAWGENIGWVNLDDDQHFVQLTCPSDLNADGILDFFDVSHFINWYVSGSLRVDWTDDGELNFFDVSGFIFDYGQGCPRTETVTRSKS